MSIVATSNMLKLLSPSRSHSCVRSAMAPVAPTMSQLLDALENLLKQRSWSYIDWHTILNNNSSTKPNASGGPMIPSLKALKTFETNNDRWRCQIDMPCSFQAKDGIVCEVWAIAQTKPEADEHACLKALVSILAKNATAVTLRQKHWNIPVHELQQECITRVHHGEHQPLVVQNLRLQNLWDGTEVYAALIAGLGGAWE